MAPGSRSADGEVACCDAPAVGGLAADVGLPVVGWAGGWALACLPSVVASAYAPPPAASTTMTASTMNRNLLPLRSGGPAGGPGGGPGGKGGAAGVTGLAELNGLAGVKPDDGYPAAWAGVAPAVWVGCQVEPASLRTPCGPPWYQEANGSVCAAGGSMRVTPGATSMRVASLGWSSAAGDP